MSGYKQAGVEYWEIRAWLDARTTLICRSLHGRLIEVGKVQKCLDNYLGACKSENKEQIKAAWPIWSEKKFQNAGIAGMKSAKLTGKGVGLPPYPFRCRTITVPYFEELNEDGVNMVNQGTQVTFWDGWKEVRHQIAS